MFRALKKRPERDILLLAVSMLVCSVVTVVASLSVEGRELAEILGLQVRHRSSAYLAFFYGGFLGAVVRYLFDTVTASAGK